MDRGEGRDLLPLLRTFVTLAFYVEKAQFMPDSDRQREEEMRVQSNGNGSQSNGHHGAYPDSHPERTSMLAYVSGSCSSEESDFIEDHCLDCPLCRTQLFTLLRSTIFSGDEHRIVSSADEFEEWELELLSSLGEQAAERAREIIRRQEQRNRWRTHSWASFGERLQVFRPALLAALVIAAFFGGSLVAYLSLWRQSSEESDLSRVREVYRDTRLLQARVTGGFAHQQYVEARSPADPTGANERARVTLLSKLDQEALTYQRAATRHNLGRLFMLHGDLEAAELLSNAVETDPNLPEAWFNRALCYERMNLFLQAESDWKQYLTFDGNSAWAEEAREHLNELRERATRLEKLEQTVQAEFRAAEAAGDEIKMRELVAGHFVPAQNLAMDQLFDKYLAAAVAGDKKQADQYLRSLKRIGLLISEIKRDRFVADAVDFAARGDLPGKREVQAIRQTLQQARQEDARGGIGAACDLYAKARNAAERIGDHAHAETAALGLVRYYRHKDESEGLAALRNKLVSDSKRRNHLQIHARALLALANVDGAAQRLSLNLEHSRQAAEIARGLGDAETAINGSRFVGYAYARLGDYDSAVKWLSEASSLLRNSWVKPIMAAAAYKEMGDALFHDGKYLISLPYQREAARICEQTGNAALLADMIHRIGLTYGMLERHEEAMRYLKDAVARAEAIPDQTARLRLQIDLYTRAGDFYLQQKKVGEAIATYRRAIESIGGANSRFHLLSIHRGLEATVRPAYAL